MSRYAAFLRGINLGSRRRVSNLDLRSLFEELGFEEVATFRGSGNIAFESPGAVEAKLTGRIEKGLAKSLGFDVTVFLRSAAEIRAIAAQRPFEPGALKSSKGKLQVALLPRKPATGACKKVLAETTDYDRLAFGERELYWLPSGGTRDSALNFKAIEELVGPTTTRTKGTIEELSSKHFADGSTDGSCRRSE